MILFLTHKSIICIGEIESFICIHFIIRRRQFLEMLIHQRMPSVLLKGLKLDALVVGVQEHGWVPREVKSKFIIHLSIAAIVGATNTIVVIAGRVRIRG